MSTVLPPKREKKRNREKLIVEFDEEARRQFLTSFSKRKQERRKNALKMLEERAKQERIAARKEYRDSLVAQKRQEVSDVLRNGVESEKEEEPTEEVVRALATDNEKVDQIVDDFSAHAFGSALVTVTTTVPIDDKTEGTSDDLAANIANAYVSRLPKNAKLKATDTERQASRLRDKLLKKKNKGKRANPHYQPKEKKGKRK